MTFELLFSHLFTLLLFFLKIKNKTLYLMFDNEKLMPWQCRCLITCHYSKNASHIISGITIYNTADSVT